MLYGHKLKSQMSNKVSVTTGHHFSGSHQMFHKPGVNSHQQEFMVSFLNNIVKYSNFLFISLLKCK